MQVAVGPSPPCLHCWNRPPHALADFESPGTLQPHPSYKVFLGQTSLKAILPRRMHLACGYVQCSGYQGSAGPEVTLAHRRQAIPICYYVVTVPPCAAGGPTSGPGGDAIPFGVLTGAIGGSAIALECCALLCCSWFAAVLKTTSGCRVALVRGAEVALAAPPGRILAAMGATCNYKNACQKVRSSCRDRGCEIIAPYPHIASRCTCATPS